MKNITRFNSILIGFTAGMITTYFMDPVRGKKRRAVLRDQTLARARDLEEAAVRVSKDISNRWHGLMVTLQSPTSENVDDATLESRVRAHFGRKIRHPKSVHTKAENGIVTLSGPILANEVKDLLSCVHRVPGVKSVINHLSIHQSSEGISGLQGEGPNYLQ